MKKCFIKNIMYSENLKTLCTVRTSKHYVHWEPENSGILIIIDTVVGGYIYNMKTTFDFGFDLYQAFKQLGYTKAWEQREAFNKKVLFIISL